MNKRKFFIATLLVAAAVSVAVVSCKKETPNALHNNNSPSVKTFAVPQVDDMNAYLKDFKKKMQTATRDGNETLSLEEAAWHLSSLANYEFANVNVDFTDLRYDTLQYQVNVTDGQVLLSDLEAVYASMESDIDAFYHSLDLQDKHFRFIGATISETGQVKTSLITSFTMLDHTWYFEDGWDAFINCYDWFDDNATYVWNTTAVDALMRAINSLEGKSFAYNEEEPQRAYYIYSMDVTFKYDEWTDPYGSSPFVGDSRLFACEKDTYATAYLEFDDMCYCLDSYLGLPFEYISHHSSLFNHVPAHWRIIPLRNPPVQGSHWHVLCHNLKVTLCYYITNEHPNQY